ncbi:ubiquitin-like protein ISG15 [Lampris incognitus]|uniref:ubiquitin-like protein ISG15 n=1 Tax=Lampris incognitus TaxID=2546036 RepID=UPI0024B61D3F|nr:ubiquitin-like protein ISG15 [Lampris incognitus]
MNLTVTLLTGESCSLMVSPQSTVGQLKVLISQKFEVAPREQRLMYQMNGHNVTLGDDSRSLSSYSLLPGSEVQLLITKSTKIQVFLKNEKGTTKTYDISTEESVSDFKRKVESMEGVPVSQMRLIHEGKEMDDQHKLRDYNVREGSTIFLTFRLRAG